MGFTRTEKWASGNTQKWLKDWETWCTMKSLGKPTLISLRIVGDSVTCWDNMHGEHKVPVKSARSQCSPQKGFWETSQPVIPFSPTLSPHAQTMFGGARPIQPQNVAGWRSWTSQGLRGKGNMLFKRRCQVFWERSFPGISSQSTVAVPAEHVCPWWLHNRWCCGLVLTDWAPAWTCSAVCLSFASASK